MDGVAVIALTCGLVVGLPLGSLAGWAIARARQQSDTAHTQMLIAQSHGDAATARAEAAQARAEAAQARSDVAEARSEAAGAQARAAEVSAEVAKAVAQRDAALERTGEIAADRESMINQFKVLSTETLDRQGQTASAQAEERLKATEQLMTPVRESLDRFNSRLTEVEKERATMSAELRAQVSYVQQTGESLRRETAALVTALRKPQIRGSWGETQLKRVAELAGMIERCDFDLQFTTKADDRVMRPDMRVNLSGGKHVFVDAKVPLSAFLEAAETDDPAIKAEALMRYARQVRTHIDQLSSKQYWKAAETPEFVVLFLPNEMFFATALDQIPNLYDYAAERDVVLATPTTLIGMLRAVAYGWRQEALGRECGRSLPARSRTLREAGPAREPLRQTGSRAAYLGQCLQRDHRPRSGISCWSVRVKTRDLNVSPRSLPGPIQMTTPCARSRPPIRR